MSKEHLSTYLNDHLAGAVAGLEIIDRMITNAGELQGILTPLRKDLESDRQELVGLMKSLGISQGRVRQATAWLAEQLAEGKFEIDDPEKGMLGRLERLEALSLGIEGKRSLWTALDVASAFDDRLAVLNYSELIERARDQRDLVERLRIVAARAALAAAA